MTNSQDYLLRIEGVERHMFDGQRRTEVRLDKLVLQPRHCYALCGPSGIGKTTALEMLSLARRPDIADVMELRVSGESINLNAMLDLQGEDALALVRGRCFGYILQTSHLFPFLTVRENILLAQNIARQPDLPLVDWLIEKLQIGSFADSLPTHLSGGQRQRVCIARALAHRPSIVLADEPTSAVDQEIALAIMTLLTTYAKQEGAALVVITHNLALAERFSLNCLAINAISSNGLQRTTIHQDNSSLEVFRQDRAMGTMR
jgi:putative ABC transport system ATP-binding protein